MAECRHLPREAREDAIADCVAYAWQSFCKLSDEGREVFPSALAKYGMKRALADRPFGSALSLTDLTSKRCQCAKGIAQTNLGRFDLADSAAANPAHAAAMRIDFAAWIDTLSLRERKLAEALASGESTIAVAKLFRLTSGRISQLRRAFQDSWAAFHAGRASAVLDAPAGALGGAA